MRHRSAWIACLLFGSGLVSLVYQTIWQKALRLVFGASTEASAAVLAIFLGGLGLGGALLGRRAERHRSPLVLYGNLEVGVALWAALSPALISGATHAYVALGGSMGLGRFGAAIVRITLATLAIGPAAFLMGGTLPAAARSAIGDDDLARRGLARIYALNTLGAVVGALVGPLFLFGTVGVQVTLFSAVCINLLVGMIARAVGRSQHIVDKLHISESAPTAEESTRIAEEAHTRAVVYSLAALAGFVFLFMELVWFRMLAPILGGSSVTFGLIVAVALTGIAIGGEAYSRRGSTNPPDLSSLILTLSLEAMCIAFPFALGDHLALITAHLRAFSNLGYWGLVGGWWMVACIVVLPAAVVAGYQFPVIFALLGQGRGGVAKEVGTTYAFNTVGTIVGSLVGGFLVIPWIGAVASWRALGVLLIAAALALAVYRPRLALRGRTLWVLLGSAGAAAGFLMSAGPGVIWRHTPIGAGRVRITQYSSTELKRWVNLQRRSIAWEADGVEVAVAASTNAGISFLVNGKSDGSVVGDRGTQIMLGLLPGALHPKPRQAFVVGLGTGTTAGMIALLPSVQRVDVAEIEPAVVEVARLSRLANGDALGNPKLHIHFGDARELLPGMKTKYDLIISEPSNPYRAGVASLFTVEFYKLVEADLAQDGLFAQWIQGYEIDAFTLSTSIRTLKSVFPNVSLWSTQDGDLVMVSSRSSQVMDASSLRAKLAVEPYRTWFLRARYAEDVEGFAAQQLLPDSKTQLLLDALPGQLNTDDLNVMEFAFARAAGLRNVLNQQLRDVVLGSRTEPAILGEIDRTRMLGLRQRLFTDTAWPGTPSEAATTMGCLHSVERARGTWPQDYEPKDAVERWVRGYGLAIGGDSRANAYADRLESRGLASAALLVRSRLALATGELDRAAQLLVSTFAALRQRALPPCDIGARAIRLGLRLGATGLPVAQRIFDGLAEGPFAVFIEEETRRHALVELAAMCSAGKNVDGTRCVRAFALNEPHPEWADGYLTQRLRCYEVAGHALAGQAREDLLDLIRMEPSRFVLSTSDAAISWSNGASSPRGAAPEQSETVDDSSAIKGGQRSVGTAPDASSTRDEASASALSLDAGQIDVGQAKPPNVSTAE